MALQLSGLATGFDWQSVVNQLIALERVPQERLRAEQTTLEQRQIAYGGIATQLGVLKTRVDTLKEASLFAARTATVGDLAVAVASATSAASPGVATFTFTQLATVAELRGAENIARPLHASSDVSSLVLSEAAFASPVTAGTFTVNGRQITIATSDTLQTVFDQISAATGGSVTAAYDPGTDRITLSSAGSITLGSAADTSNFLAVAQLYNNGTGTISSANALGSVKTWATLANANFAAPLSDGGSGAGEFKINGVAISFNAATDTVATVLSRINASEAGVTASYDSINDRFLLTNKTTGDVGIALEDVTGNFLAASGLASGTLSRGQNLLYSVNGGSQRVSLSNTIAAADSPVAGLSVTALKEGTTTIEVGTDTAKIKTAITDFLAEYNKLQAMIDKETASSTDAKGKVTAGVLAGDWQANELASTLRSLANGVVSGLSGTIRQLDHLGIVSNGTDNSLSLADSAKLEAALASHLNAVRDLFTREETGLAVRLGAFLERITGEEGTLTLRQNALTKQIAAIDTQIADLERLVQANEQRLINSFVAMEAARTKINQQLLFLQQRLGLTT